jgi:protocatechuate 3,4-dioxygenase alpha subunit
MPVRLQTPSQTVGPFFGVGLGRDGGPLNVMVTGATEGERIRIAGAVLDGAGRPVDDALVELWQANAHGRYRHPLDVGSGRLDPAFSGFGRCPTDANGVFVFDTVKPGAIHEGGGLVHAPHVNVTLFARGMLVHAFTRIYFDGDRLDGDPALAAVDPSRRQTLVAERGLGPDGGVLYRWNIHLQGERETVFFDA